MNRHLIILLVLITCLVPVAWGEDRIDSLKQLLQTEIHDTTRINTLNELASILKRGNPDTSIILSTQALELSEKAGYRRGIATSWHNLAEFNWRKSNYAIALKYNHKALEIRKQQNDRKGMASTYNNIGVIYKSQSDFPQALEYYFKSLKIEEELSNSPDEVIAKSGKQGMAGSYITIGVIYLILSDYPVALDYSLKAIRILEEGGNKNWLAAAYNNIGIIYKNQFDYPLALSYYFKSLKIKEELGNKRGVAFSYDNIAKLYILFFGKDSVLKGLFLTIEQDSLHIAHSALLDSAMVFEQKALLIDKEIGNEFHIVVTLGGVGDIHSEKGNYQEAIKHYRHAAQLADSIGELHINFQVQYRMAECYAKLGNHQRALEHHKQYSTLKDSIFNEEKSKDLGRLEAKHEFETAEIERKRLEIEELRLQNEQKSRRDNLQYSGILIFLVLVFAGVFMLGRISIPIRLAEGMIFFAFLLFFEFTLVLLDPYIEQYSSGAPAIKLAFNAVLAGLIFPLHSFFEERLKGRLAK